MAILPGALLTMCQRRTPHSGKQKKAQLQAERRRRAAGPGEEEAAAASEAQEAVVRAYHVDACGYRWRRSTEDAVLVGMVVQRARGGGVVVRLCLRPAVTGLAPAAAAAAAAVAAAADPMLQACKRLQTRMRHCDGELSGLARFKPSEVGGQRWRHEASRWAVMAHRVAAIGADPGPAPCPCVFVESSRPEASASSPSAAPRQRQMKRRAASSLGQPRPISRCVSGRPAIGACGPCSAHRLHTGCTQAAHMQRARRSSLSRPADYRGPALAALRQTTSGGALVMTQRRGADSGQRWRTGSEKRAVGSRGSCWASFRQRGGRVLRHAIRCGWGCCLCCDGFCP